MKTVIRYHENMNLLDERRTHVFAGQKSYSSFCGFFASL